MAKRYHQGRKDREDESRGMKRYYRKERMENSEYDRRSEREEDYGMIREDHEAPANLPQHVVHRYYPRGGYGPDYDIDDTIRGVDDQMMDDDRGLDRHLSPEKY